MLPKESTSSRMQTSEVDVDSVQSGALEHLLPDASFLLYGVFAQSGFDLEITNPDGIAHVVPDYFSFPTPPNLMIESGAGLSPAMVKSLFPRAFGQDVLFAGPAPSGSALVEIGSVKLVVGTVTVRHADGSQETVIKGAILYQGDVLVTGAGSFIKAEMRDGTKFQLGQNGEAALDQYEFDEAADVGRFEATVRVGGFYYKSGKIGELPSASAQAHTQLNTPTSIIGVRGSELEGVVDQSGETVVVHRSGVLEITDINGENAVTLDTPGNTAVVVLNGQPAFTTEPSQQAQQALQQSLPPPDGSTAEDEAVEADAEEEVVEEAVAEAEEAVEESTEEEVLEEVLEEVVEEVEEAEEAELDESDDAEEEAEENSDEEDLDSLGVDESGVDSQGDAESAEDGARNEGEVEVVETGDDEALSTSTNPDTSVESATDDLDTTLETLQSQDSNVEGQDSGDLQTLDVASSNVEESVFEVEDVAAEEPQEVIAPDNPPQALADEITVVAGNAIDVTDQLLGNDSDPDFGQVLVIVSVNSTRPDAVTLVDGRVQFQPDESLLQSLGVGESTTETLSYTLESGNSRADADVVIVYQGSNDAPIANNDVAETDEDAPLVLTVVSNDSDPDLADTLVIASIDSSTALGVVTIAEDGQSLLYEPSQSLSEGSIDDVFSYTISDGTTTATATVTVTVTGLNDPPVLVSDPTGFTLELTPEAGEISIPLDAIFSDSDLGSTLTVLALDTELTRGSVRIGSVLYDPGDAFDYLKEGEIGIEQFGITVQDELGQTGQGVFSFQIEGVNDAPVAVGNTNAVLENGEIELVVDQSLLLDDTDVDGGALLVSGIRAGSLDDLGTSGSIGAPFSGAYGTLTVNANGSYSYTANIASSVATDEVVEDVFTYTVSDGSLSSSAELRIEVTGVSDGPLAIGITDALLENDEIERVVDTGVLSNQIEGDTLLIAGIRIGTLLESGVEGAIGEPLVGVYGTLTLNQNGSYSYLANVADSLSADEVVEDVFTYTVSDGSLTSSAELRFTVTGLNDRPIAASNQDAVLENGTLESAADKNLLLDDVDVDGDTLSVSALRSGSITGTGSSGTLGESLTGLYGSLTLDADGSYRYTANAAEALASGEEVEDVFSYTVSDGTLNSSAELRISVTGVNDPPVATDNVDTVPENGEIASVVDKSLLSNDEDVDGDVLSVTAIRAGALDEDGASGTIGVALTGAYGTLTLNANGSYSYVANAADSLAADIVVEDVFAYTVSDGAATSIAELRITVTGANDGPVAVNNTDSVFENGEIASDAGKSLLLNDADIDSDTLTVVAVYSGTSNNVGTTGAVGTGLVGDYGTLTLDADGIYSYAANASATEALAAGTVVEDVFTYTVSDGLVESSAEIRISVTGVNDAPVAVADQVNAIQGQSAVDINVLINDQDVDGDALSLTLVGASAGGTVIVNEDQTLSYTPLPSFSGEELITYSISDGNGGSATVQLAVAVSASEMGPIALNDVASIEEDTLLLNFDVLANDSAPVGETLTLTSATSESAATITINEDGTLSYQGPSDFYGSDIVSYSIQDSQGRVSQAAVEITITPVNDDPIASSNVDAIAENGLIEFEEDKSLLSDDLDVDGDTLAVSAIRAGASSEQGANGAVGESLVGAYGTLTLNANGNYSYAANAGAVEDLSAGTVVEDVFTYTVSDGALSSNAELRISVTGVNDAPIAVTNVEAVAEDELIADKNLLIDDSDIDDDALSVSAVRSGALNATGTTGTIGSALSGTYGTLTLNANGSYSYAANMADSLSSGEIAEDVFSYTVSDGSLNSSAELRITVTGVNDPPVAIDNVDTVPENGEIAPVVDKSMLSNDEDVDGDVLSVTAIRAGALDEEGASGTIGVALTGAYGTLTLNANGSYSYDANASAVEALATGSTVEDVFTYTVSDGSLTSSAELRVTVIGANDRPVAVSNVDSVVENGVISEVAGINLLLNDADIDGDTLVVSAVRAGEIAQIGTSGTIGEGLTGAYGILILNADGTFRYTANSNAVEALAAGTVDEDVFTYSVSDGALTASAELRITVTGVNDPADLSVTALDASVTRNATFDGSASGQITLTDADLGEASIASATAFFGVVTVAEDGGWVYDLDDTNDAVLALDENLAETLVDTITFTSVDGSEVSLDVSIFTANLPATLTLTLDNPSGLALTAGDLANQTITGQITVTDNEGAILLPITANYGDVTQVGDEWTYSLQNESISVQGLDEGEVVTDTIVFLTDDARDLNADTVILDVSGSIEGRQTLTVTISGVNDAPVVTLAAIETDQFDDEIMVGSAEGVLRFAIDPDNADGSVTDTLTVVGARQGGLSSSSSVVAVNQLVSGSYGTLTVQTDGSYSYSADSGLQDLALEDTDLIEDVFTVQVSDGTETVEAELRFNIDNAAPVAVNGARMHQVVTTGSSGLLVNYADFDDLTITLSQADALPSGFVVTTPSSAIGRDLSVTGSVDTLPESSVFFGSLTSVVGDYRLISSVSDGDNPVASDQFILSVRSPTILSSIDQVYEFVSGESDYAAVYLDPAENPGILSVYAWAPSEAGDRLAVFGNTSISIYSETGTNLTLEGAALVDLNSSPGADVLTIRGSVAGLNFAGISAIDTLVNQSLILASPGANQFQLQNEGIVQLTSSGVGDRYSFEDASGNPITSPIVGIAQSDSVSFGDTVQTEAGQILLTPDNQPAAPYLVLASLITDGIVEITGYNQVSISQPAELEVSTTSVNPLSGSLIQSASGTISISSGGQITTETLSNSGTITLTNNNYDGLISGGAGSAGHLAVTGTYTEAGVLISQVSDSFYIPASDLNELSVVDMVLTGEIKANADLLFSNVSQSLDWRAGSITLAPNADLIIAGGSVVLSAESTIIGYGDLMFGQASASVESDSTIVIDGAVSTAQFDSGFNFDSSRVTIAALTNAAADTLTIANLDQWTLDNEVVNTNLQIAGTFEVNGGRSALNGSTIIATSGVIRLNESLGVDTNLIVSQTLTNLGNIEINLDPLASGELIYSPSISISGGSYSAAAGEITIDTSAAHGLATGDVIRMRYAFPEGYNYTGEVTVTSTTSFSFAAASDPGAFQSGGSIDDFSTSLILSGGFTNSGSLVVQGTKLESADQTLYSDARVLIDGDITNSAGGSLIFREGDIILEGNLSNAGILAVDGATSAGSTSYSGANVTLDGDLILASTSNLQLEVTTSSGYYYVNGLYLEAGAIVRGVDADASNLGGLTLNFNDSSLGSNFSSQDSNTLSLFYDNVISGANFITLTTDLAAGYEAEVQATVSSSDSSVQTISVVVSDDMEFESSASGSFGEGSTVWARQPLLADVASASWSAGVATLVTSAAHGLTDNQTVDIYGAESGGYNAYSVVISVVDERTLTYSIASDPGTDPGDLQVTDYYASNVAIVSADWSSIDSTVTVVTDGKHGLATGQVVDIFGSAPTTFDVYYQTVTVVDATTFTVSLGSDPGTWISGGAIVTQSPTINDDVRIVHALTVEAAETVSLNSFSLESETTYGSATTTTTVGTLSLEGDFDATAETTTLNVADQSTVAYGSSLYVGGAESTSIDTVKLVLGGALIVHGGITLGSGAVVDSGGNGKIVISEIGQGFIWDSAELNLTVEIEAGGGLSLTPLDPQVITGSGQIINSGVIEAGVYNGISVGVDIVNHGDLELRFDNTSIGAFDVVAGSDTTIVSDGRLIASSVRSGSFSLNDNTLDVRGGELAIFVNSELPDTYGLTLVGGSTAASPGLIKLQDTVFSIPGRAVTISAVETSTAGIWTISFTVSEPISYLDLPVILGGTLGSLSDATNNIDGSVTFTAEATKDPSGNMVITLADNVSGEYLGGELTIDSGGGTSFTSNLGTTGELSLTGYLEFQLTGTVDFGAEDDTLALTLQGNTADGIRLANGTTETAILVNSETIYFNNLTVDTNVILVNSVDPDWTAIDPAAITLSGVSVFDGDLYNLRNPEGYSADTTGVYLLDSVTFNGAVLQQAGTYLYVGVDATLIGGRATSVGFTNDFVNDGFMTVGSPAGALNHLIKVGSDAAAGTFSNSGNLTIEINATGEDFGTVELDGVLLNTGSVYALGQLTLDATSSEAKHESSGLIYFSGLHSGLTLGSSDTLTINAGSYLIFDGTVENSIIDASAAGAGLVLSGTLGIGDTVTNYLAGVVTTTAATGTLEVKTSGEFTVSAGSVITLDAGFGTIDSDLLSVGGPAGVLRLNGGRLSVNSTYSTATSVGLIGATTILGSFDTIDGLILETSGSRTVADVVQTATGITLTPVLNSAVVLAEGDGTGSVFDFGGSSEFTHYLAAGGDDLIKGLESGDSAFGEAGDDTFVLNSVAINRIDGGTGIDQIVLPGTVNFDFTKAGGDNTLGTADDWLGHRFERIELLSMEDATSQAMALDASALRSINDGSNALLNDEAGLVIKGNIGDVINLSGDFDYTEDRFVQMRTANEPSSGSAVTMTYAPELFTGVSDGAVSLFFDQDMLVNVTHTNGGVSRYGHSGVDVLEGSSVEGETLVGRGGDDQLDALGGADRQLGGDGNDSIVFDGDDLEMDGGNGVDTLMLSGSVDFSNLDQLTNFEQVDMSGNGSLDSLSLTFADVFELVGDNSLDAYVPANDHKILVINGDSDDALILDGVDIRNQTPVETGIDLYGDGTTYALFQDTNLGVDVYVLSDLLSAANASGSDKVSGPVMGTPALDQYLYEPALDHFGGI